MTVPTTTKLHAYYLWAAHGLPIGLGIAVYPTEQTLESVGAAWSAILGDVYATVDDHPETLTEAEDVMPYEGLPGFWVPGPGGLRPHLSAEQEQQVRGLGLAQFPPAPGSIDREKFEHAQRHRILHKYLDELIADYLAHHRYKRPSNTTMLELMQWSHAQTENPTERPT